MAVCWLAVSESVMAESGAMVSMSPNINIASVAGGVTKGLKRRLLGGESFFQNTFTAQDAPGEVALAPALPGDIVRIRLDGEAIVQGSSYLASSPAIAVDTKFKGFKGFFSGEGAFMLKASGTGDLLVNAFGAIHEMDVDGEVVVDTGHVVAFDSGLDFRIRRVGGWIATLFSGEGLVCRFHGKGRIWMQSRNPKAYGSLIGRLLPPLET